MTNVSWDQALNIAAILKRSRARPRKKARRYTRKQGFWYDDFWPNSNDRSLLTAAGILIIPCSSALPIAHSR